MMTHRLVFILCIHAIATDLRADEIHIYGKEEQGENEGTLKIARQFKLWPNCFRRYE